MPSLQEILRHFLLFTIFALWTASMSSATPIIEEALEERAPVPLSDEPHWEWKRTEFPDTPVSCKFCEQHFDEIDSCANASTVFANPAQIIFNPLSFVTVIECACTDTFKSTYPQCVDCFEQTNQTVFLEPEGGNFSSIITGMRQICALGSAIFGGVASANSQLPGQTPVPAPSPNAALRRFVGMFNSEGGGLLSIAFLTVILSVMTGAWTVL
ncbi:hypothetical protein FRB91_011000 [Serendipita sp. 411]|nr:hypothetical protein FRC20_003931 [Serendipita sp. 405]KAG8848246.1 hypothetical protein FRB91_011000 [Serendipita sp. 411]